MSVIVQVSAIERCPLMEVPLYYSAEADELATLHGDRFSP